LHTVFEKRPPQEGEIQPICQKSQALEIFQVAVNGSNRIAAFSYLR
jgi:hypothetical protein